jgi:hypothetical protein
LDSKLLAVLLRENESTSLDFKRDQYRFVSNIEKGELLKDMLAFANSWRHADAYILIGVDEQQNNAVVGVSAHFDDASLQQFVNSKTQRPATFSYETLAYQGKQIDVITIPLQERPVYLKKDFGLLKKETVYIRRGSSTDIASPDEVAEMGKASITVARTPTLQLEFVDPTTSKSLGTKLQLSSTVVQYQQDKIPSYSSNRGLITAISLHENANYYRELASYIRTIEFFRTFKLQTVSTSGELAEDVALVLNVDQRPDVKFSSDRYAQNKPKKAGLDYNLRAINYQTSYALNTTASGSSLHVHFGNVRPRAISNPPGYFSIGSHASTNVKMDGYLYGNNIADPIPVSLEIDLDVKERELGLEELQN